MYKLLVWMVLILPCLGQAQQKEFMGLAEDSVGTLLAQKDLILKPHRSLDISVINQQHPHERFRAYLLVKHDTLYSWIVYFNQQGIVIAQDTRLSVDHRQLKAYQELIDHFNLIKDEKYKHAFHRITKENHKYVIKEARNEWRVYLWEQSNQSPYANLAGVAFKHRLFNFHALSLIKNIRQRRLVNSFFSTMGIQNHYQACD